MSEQIAAPNLSSTSNDNDRENYETCEAAKKPVLLPKTVESESQTDAISGNKIALNRDHSISCETITSNLIVNDQVNDLEVDCKYFAEPEVSLVQIHEKLIDQRNFDNVALDDSESEEDDQLKPLMVDNHQECYLTNRQIQQLMKHSDTKDSISSTDSDVSTGYDRGHMHLQGDSIETQYLNESSKDIDSDLHGENLEIKEIDTLTPEEIPDDKMCEEIVEHVEFYFSNDNILKDAFLLKHVRRNKEGFVSLKLVSSFKRVRQLTKDWRVVGYAIRRKSRKIELNDLATKIRRIDPLPTFDETMPSRTIVACDLPVDKLCIERVSDIFSKCGEIALIRILRPGNAIPVDVRQFMNKYPEMQQKECALVEFVESQYARNAQNLNGPFKVFEMVAPKKKTGKKAVTVTKLIENYKYNEPNFERSRGGGGGGIVGGAMPLENDFKFKLRRNNSEYYMKPDQTHICNQRKYSFNNITSNTENTFMHYPRRVSSCSVSSGDMSRKYSSCSEGYSSCSEMSRRTSTCSSDQSRRTSNCSEYCPCSRRASQCSDMYRRMSQCSEHNVRKFSNGSVSYDRSFSNPQDMGRRISMDSAYDRKMSNGSMHEGCRKFSNGFDPNRKLSNSDQYYNGRRLSTDSGYDRKMSFGSDYSGGSPRSRSNSFMMCQHKNTESVVRTPIGPDGSKGFNSRARKVGQIIAPV